MSDNEAPRFDVWAVIELLGHRRLIGRVTEQEIAGAGFLRIDIPGVDDESGQTQFVAPGSVYAITPVAESLARMAVRDNQPPPISVYELPLRVREVLRHSSAEMDPTDDETYGDEPF